MRITAIAPLYAPDGGPSAPLYTMLCEGLASRGHQVTAITTVPHYPTGRVAPGFRGVRLQRTRERGVDVVRVPLPSLDRARLSRRMLQFACYQLGATWAGLFARSDVLIVGNPSLEVWLPFAVHAVLRHTPAVFSVHDVYPDVGVKLGIFRNKAVTAGVAWLERFCLEHAASVRVLSPSFRRMLAAHGVPEGKMTLIYDWVDTDLVRPLPRDNAFAREHGLHDRFVVQYAGNIGLSQGLEHVLQAARLLAGRDGIRFLFVGEGTGRERLMAEAEQHRLSNVQFLPFQPRARLPEVLATADLSLVVLQRRIASASLPSKSFSILASGRPLVASADEESDLCHLVRDSGAGVCVPPEDPQALADAILALEADAPRRMCLGRKGREYAERHHSPQAATEQFEALLQGLLSARSGGQNA